VQEQADSAAQAGLTVFELPPEHQPPNLYVLDGALRSYTAAQRAAKDALKAGHRWSNATMAWQDLRSLQSAKAAKNAEINAARLSANRSTFTFSGKAIACDELSRSDIDGAHGIILMTGALPPGWPGGWKAVDNTYVAIPDVATWGAFYAAMVSQGMANFAKAQTLKAQLAAAATIAEVEVLQW
jgi:hypothetical protein